MTDHKIHHLTLKEIHLASCKLFQYTVDECNGCNFIAIYVYFFSWIKSLFYSLFLFIGENRKWCVLYLSCFQILSGMKFSRRREEIIAILSYLLITACVCLWRSVYPHLVSETLITADRDYPERLVTSPYLGFPNNPSQLLYEIHYGNFRKPRLSDTQRYD